MALVLKLVSSHQSESCVTTTGPRFVAAEDITSVMASWAFDRKPPAASTARAHDKTALFIHTLRYVLRPLPDVWSRTAVAERIMASFRASAIHDGTAMCRDGDYLAKNTQLPYALEFHLTQYT